MRGTCAELNPYLILGGAPEGINFRPGELGCRRNSVSISINTVIGNSSTRPKGIVIVELPFKRIRRRKKANRGDNRWYCRISSSVFFDGSRW
jgi:hypothetical protein